MMASATMDVCGPFHEDEDDIHPHEEVVERFELLLDSSSSVDDDADESQKLVDLAAMVAQQQVLHQKKSLKAEADMALARGQDLPDFDQDAHGDDKMLLAKMLPSVPPEPIDFTSAASKRASTNTSSWSSPSYFFESASASVDAELLLELRPQRARKLVNPKYVCNSINCFRSAAS
jgi:hypothetical protein